MQQANINQPLQTPPTRKPQRWIIAIPIVFFVAILLAGAGFTTATVLEEHDDFCTSCHTVPETTYYNRAIVSLAKINAPVTDLATAHYNLSKLNGKPDFTCIYCHRGDSSLGQRISTVALGSRDALIFVLGKADPTLEKSQVAESWLPNAACVSCHTATLLTLNGLGNHFHNNLPQAAAALANGGQFIVPVEFNASRGSLLRNGLDTIDVSLQCSDCHQSHKTIADGAASVFTEADRVNQACESCHKAASTRK